MQRLQQYIQLLLRSLEATYYHRNARFLVYLKLQYEFPVAEGLNQHDLVDRIRLTAKTWGVNNTEKVPSKMILAIS